MSASGARKSRGIFRYLGDIESGFLVAFGLPLTTSSLLGDPAVIDTFAKYIDGSSVNDGASGERGTTTVTWSSNWVAKDNFTPAFLGLETFNDYSAASDLNGQNAGTNWYASWVVADNFTSMYLGDETFNSETVGNDINGANNGTGWVAAWVAR